MANIEDCPGFETRQAKRILRKAMAEKVKKPW